MGAVLVGAVVAAHGVSRPPRVGLDDRAEEVQELLVAVPRIHAQPPAASGG